MALNRAAFSAEESPCPRPEEFRAAGLDHRDALLALHGVRDAVARLEVAPRERGWIGPFVAPYDPSFQNPAPALSLHASREPGCNAAIWPEAKHRKQWSRRHNAVAPSGGRIALRPPVAPSWPSHVSTPASRIGQD